MFVLNIYLIYKIYKIERMCIIPGILTESNTLLIQTVISFKVKLSELCLRSIIDNKWKLKHKKQISWRTKITVQSVVDDERCNFYEID